MSKNIIRDTSSIASPYLKQLIGHYYIWIHILIGFMGGFILFFSNNLVALLFLFIIISTDALTIIILHDCPLTMLEQQYLGRTCIQMQKKIYKKMKIVYKCNHSYETQLEFVINLACFTIVKIFCIIIMQMFDWKLV